MKRIITMWKKDTRGKIILVVGSIISFCLTCLIIIGLLPSPDNTATKASINAEDIFTQAASTIAAQLTQTAVPNSTPSILETPTLHMSPTAAQTATSLPLPTPTIETIEGISCITDSSPQTGTVLEIIDGDTIRVLLDDGLIYSVRYIGMDTPENTKTTEYYGAEATQRNRELVEGKEIILFKDDSTAKRDQKPLLKKQKI